MDKDFNKREEKCKHTFTKINELVLLGGAYEYYHCESCERVKVVAIKNRSIEQSWKK